MWKRILCSHENFMENNNIFYLIDDKRKNIPASLHFAFMNKQAAPMCEGLSKNCSGTHDSSF